ncbi:uncharacterized protein [Argopecten irradians]|uniref:uncharacterized protein n=1 Tax=Argopecten irradians TaxID=31199 RepID=UPI003721BA74
MIKTFKIRFDLGTCFLIVLASATDKRILMSDPNYVAQQLNHLQSELQDLKVQVESQKRTIDTQQLTIIDLQGLTNSQQAAIQKLSNEDTGVVYTRWGRQDCPLLNGSQTVYSGYIGGGYFNNPGDASNSLCMPDDPTAGHSTFDTNYSPSNIYGAELQQGYYVFGLPQNDEDITCSVCRDTLHTASIMVPGRTECYPGWEQAYGGFIVAGWSNATASTDYICMDSKIQAIPGGQQDDNGVLFRPAVTRCESLPCPPYEEGKLVPCVVCVI